MSAILEVFSEVFSEAAAKSAGTWLAETVKERLTSVDYPAVFVTLSAEAANVAAETIIGPMLRVFLKALDQTSKKLDDVRDEPLRTALTVMSKSLGMRIVNESDRRIRDEQFFSALASFDKAYTNAARLKDVEKVRIRIRLAQATIAKRMDAPGAVEGYLSELIPAVKAQLRAAEAEVATKSKDLRDAEDLLTPEGARRTARLRDEMLTDLGPQPPPGIPSSSPLGLELGVDNNSWRHVRQGIVNGAQPPSKSRLAELQRKLDIAQEGLNRIATFVRFWEISQT
jgi:hypothetical protein